jgi:hypothetical protein
MKKKIAVIGAGFFGISIALILKKHDVTIFERNKDILLGASKKNQLRFHKGYHYPRSLKTLKEIEKLNHHFTNFFKKSILGTTKNYYAVANKGSKVKFSKYIQFLKKNKLPFKQYNGLHYNISNIEGSIVSNESNLNFFKIRDKIINLLKKTKIKLNLNTKFNKSLIPKFDKIIIACYDQNNIVLKSLNISPKRKYRYELVEKIVISLPKKFLKKSFMVLDGEFVSLDPFLGTKNHLLSDVKNSKIEIIKNGYFPNFKDYRKKYLNRGVIKNLKVSNFKKFISRCSKFIPILKKAKYKGSFFVTRSIEINKEKSDERLNSILNYNKKIYTVHSGKWNTSIGLAKDLAKKINHE